MAGKTRPKLRGGIFAAQHKQIVESRNRTAERDAREALVEAVKKFGAAGTERFGEQPAAGVLGQGGAPRPNEAMRTIPEIEALIRVCGGEPRQHLTRIEAHAGECVTDAVGGVQCNRQIRIVSFSGIA